MARNRLLLAGMMLLGASFSMTAGAAMWAPLNPGDVVDFLIPIAADQPAAISDAAVLSGGKITDLDVSGCASGVQPVQHYVLLDPSGARSPKLGGAVALTTDPIQPSTRLSMLTFSHTCMIGSVEYGYYQGTVQ